MTHACTSIEMVLNSNVKLNNKGSNVACLSPNNVIIMKTIFASNVTEWNQAKRLFKSKISSYIIMYSSVSLGVTFTNQVKRFRMIHLSVHSLSKHHMNKWFLNFCYHQNIKVTVSRLSWFQTLSYLGLLM